MSARVLEYGRTLAAGNARPLACLVRDGSGAVVAGASGRTEYGRLFVNSLWVDEALRGAGSALNPAPHGARCAPRGCGSALIETLGERACVLYCRVGYELGLRPRLRRTLRQVHPAQAGCRARPPDAPAIPGAIGRARRGRTQRSRECCPGGAGQQGSPFLWVPSHSERCRSPCSRRRTRSCCSVAV